MIYEAVIKIHVWTSSLFVLVAIIVSILSFRGFVLNKVYLKRNSQLENLFIVLLYFGLVLGIIMYFFINAQHEHKMLSYEEALENSQQKFWAIEHFCAMLVGLILAQIGKIFTIKKIPDINKYSYALFYYGASTIITFVSTGIFIFNKIR